MENEFRVIDLILAIILIVVMCVGIGMCFVKAPTMSGKLTTENYQKYFSVNMGYKTVSASEIEFSLTFKPKYRYEVTNVSMTISITGKSIGSRTVNVSFSATQDEPYRYKQVFGFRQPTIEEALGGWGQFEYEIISVSGQFSKGKIL